MQQPLNRRSHAEDAAGTHGRVALAEDFTEDLRNGRNTPWLGDVDGILPTFVDLKQWCPITGVPTVWRVIRDASCGCPSFPSLNSLTPDAAAKTELITKRTVLKYLRTMHLLYGVGCLLAKTDLDGAFRKYYLAISEPSKIGRETHW